MAVLPGLGLCWPAFPGASSAGLAGPRVLSAPGVQPAGAAPLSPCCRTRLGLRLWCSPGFLVRLLNAPPPALKQSGVSSRCPSLPSGRLAFYSSLGKRSLWPETLMSGCTNRIWTPLSLSAQGLSMSINGGSSETQALIAPYLSAS